MANKNILYDDDHFKKFASSLEYNIKSYGEKDEKNLLERQKKQVEKLVSLEKEFRKTLIKHPWGLNIYRDFIKLICENKRNILAARPFFRERQDVFTSQISKALKSRQEKTLYKFHFNYQFVLFVLRSRKWPKGGKIYRLAAQISDIRREIVEMNMPLAISRARIFYSKTPKAQLSYMDLIQISCEGLMSAVDKFCLPFSKVFRAVAIGRMVGNFIEQYSLLKDTILKTVEGVEKHIEDFKPGDLIYGIDNFGKTIETEVVDLHDHGVIDGFEITFDNGYQVTCSPEHKFLTKYGMKPLKEIIWEDLEIYCEPSTERKWLDSSMRGEIQDSQREKDTSETMSDMYSESSRKTPTSIKDSTKSQHLSKGVAKSVWDDILAQEAAVFSSCTVSCLSGGSKKREITNNHTMAPCQSRTSESQLRVGGSDVFAMAERQSRGGSKIKNPNISKTKTMAHRSSARKCSNNKKLTHLPQKTTFQTRDLPERIRNCNLGNGSNLLSGQINKKTKIGGLRVSGFQNMDRSGRILALQSTQKHRTSTGTSKLLSIKRSNSQRGSNKASRCDVNSDIGELFCEKKETSIFTSPVAKIPYKIAPLTSPGGLVLRKIVRIRHVGFQRMFDLEVSHPKHNFLLPSGIVTSNSETFVHFYPIDKRKIYRANKAIHKFTDRVDFERLAAYVNENINPQHHTTAAEIHDLMAAASCVSTDSSPPSTKSTHEEDTTRAVDKYMAPNETRPDVIIEQRQVHTVLQSAISELSLLELKLLKMKGMSFND